MKATSLRQALAGTWAVAGTPVTDPYPCLCHTRKYNKCSPRYCPCAGRTDHHRLPAGFLPDDCCARTPTEGTT